MSLLLRETESTLKMLSTIPSMSKAVAFSAFAFHAGSVKSPVSHKASSIDSWNGASGFSEVLSLSASRR